MKMQLSKSQWFLVRLGLLVAGLALIYALMVTSAAVSRADGCEASAKDDCDYAYSAPRTSSRAVETPHRLRAYLSPSELRDLRRIKARAEMRMREEGVRRSRYTGRSRFDPPIRYARSSRYATDAEYRDTSSACKPAIQAEGRERTGRERAIASSWNDWRVSVQNRWGHRYADVDLARVISKPHCTPVRGTIIGGQVYVCEVVARPCREF